MDMHRTKPLTRMGRVLLAVAFSAAFALGHTLIAGPSPEPSARHQSGPVTIESFPSSDGSRLEFVASNVSPDVVDLRLQFEMQNMRLVEGDRRVLLAPGRLAQRVAVIERTDPGAAFRYSFKYRYTFGDPAASNAGNYLPPIASGSSFTVSNAFFGTGAHKDATAHSIDLPMPERTPIHAARTGIVVRTKADSNEGGPDPSFADKANYIAVRHKDGTYAFYMHLCKDCVEVRPGQLVLAGARIGLSGNTGWSTGPHLHFHVSIADGEGGYRTVPWKLLIGEKELTPVVGMQLQH